MTTALGIAGVTAVLRDLLNDGIVNHDVDSVLGTSVTVSVGPPDRVVPANGIESSQLNLFLHRVTPNPGWSNAGWPSHDGSGRQRLSNPPLALDLHYLLSAYSSADLHGEILLGYGMQLLHETPVLTRAAIRTALSPSPDVGPTLPPALRALRESGLDDQVEQIRITPEYLDGEELSRLWTATQANMRPTAAYVATVVLIQAQRSVRAPLPVLSRGPVDPGSGRDRGVVANPDLLPPLPALEAVRPQDGQPVVRLGQPVDLVGYNLDGTDRRVLLANDRFTVEQTLVPAGGAAPTVVAFTVPVARAADFPVGVYRIGARLVRAGETEPRDTNRLAATLAPHITGLPMAVARDGSGTATFSLDFHPAVRDGQAVVLVLGQQEVRPQPFTPPVTSLTFTVADAPVGSHLVRLRVDGIDSPIVDRASDPPAFLDQRVTIT